MIAGIYAAVATLWIYYSDAALLALLNDPELLVRWSIYKGLAFVAVTAVMLLLMMRRAFGRIGKGYEELKAHEKELERQKRLYAALSQINQSIVWTRSREELLPKICQSLTQHGGFDMAWIGQHDEGTHRLLPVAASGDENGYLQDIQIYTDDRPEGQGPSGTAFRQKQPYVCNDLLNDPAAQPWRAQASRRGWMASAVFPLLFRGEVWGTLNVYAKEAGFFQNQECDLLAEAATDIAYALDNLAGEEEKRQAETVAQREMVFSATMIESMPGILYFYNEQGKFLRWNRNFETVTGYTGAEIARMHPLDFFASEDQRPLEERIAEVFAQGESHIEAPFLAKDGQTTPYFFTGRRVDYDGMRCLVGVGIDISERKAAEVALTKSEQRYRTTLENILEGCQILAPDWTYLYMNQAAADHNRRPREELLGKTMLEVWPGIEAAPVFTLLKRCQDERIGLHEETEFRFMDGTSGWFDVRVQPVPEGIFVLSIDITERHEAEKKLVELNESLELKVAERTEELRQALVRAEAADRLKSAFLATMSHELRTPLNSIIGFTGILLQGLAGPLNEEQHKQMGMVRGSARHLLELINDVLDLSKIEAGQLEVRNETFDLREVMDRVVGTLRPMAQKKGLLLDVERTEEAGKARGDRRRMEQVLINLVNNGIKFTEAGSVTLKADVLADYQPADGTAGLGPAVRLQVVDTGMGIKPADLGNLFLPFRQIDTGLSRQHEGTGLGLAICRRLIGLMGGEISAASEWGKGSTFTVILPLDRDAPSKPEPESGGLT
ncbi:PAS domain S-box protein [Prosthecobacter sp. SYSU 5D2]|uniref:sensor histidine kinase n=1 Tax=Prosthecobacter sp. SYSU 5D2 TaxID=3134134 RepID=UPI0031FEA28C